MSNLIDRDPMIIDTPGVSVLRTDPIRVRGIRWVGATTAGHQAIVTDQFGTIKWHSIANGGNNVEGDRLDNERLWSGLIVPTLESGKLYIELW